ncbi:twin transmembrane helix small protein [Hyphomonas sp. FCG-A18]|jgi:hypothetical protein|uniref:twin transmembrane helix small protein n=1 Tax=Hyphomonas sp. FCG-A18 TaxID=3080019 RepID=UPI002B2A0E96|nr:twin transmembrane helix small protein [Hyphomonas sp. FCG-A18]
MATLLSYGFYIALAALIVVLVLGLINITRPSSEEQSSRSNKLMRLRVIIQFVVIAILVLLGIVLGSIKLF